MQCPGCGVAHAHPHGDLHGEIEHLPNLGEVSAVWLKEAGYGTLAELTTAGAVHAFLRVEAMGRKPSLNLLYALEGAIHGEHWLQVKRDCKTALLAALEAAREKVKA